MHGSDWVLNEQTRLASVGCRHPMQVKIFQCQILKTAAFTETELLVINVAMQWEPLLQPLQQDNSQQAESHALRMAIVIRPGTKANDVHLHFIEFSRRTPALKA